MDFHLKSSLPFQTDVIIVSIVHQIKTKIDFGVYMLRNG